MEMNDKNKLLDVLSLSYNRAFRLETICQEKNLRDEEAKAKRRKKRLKTEIDGLLRDIYVEWIGNANTLRDTITLKNEEIDNCIQDIESNIDTAQKVIKAIGYIDAIIKIASDLVS